MIVNRQTVNLNSNDGISVNLNKVIDVDPFFNLDKVFAKAQKIYKFGKPNKCSDINFEFLVSLFLTHYCFRCSLPGNVDVICQECGYCWHEKCIAFEIQWRGWVCPVCQAALK